MKFKEIRPGERFCARGNTQMQNLYVFLKLAHRVILVDGAEADAVQILGGQLCLIGDETDVSRLVDSYTF